VSPPYPQVWEAAVLPPDDLGCLGWLSVRDLFSGAGRVRSGGTMLTEHDLRGDTVIGVAAQRSGRSAAIRVLPGGRMSVISTGAVGRVPRESERSSLFRCWRCGEWRLPYIRHRCDPARRVPLAARTERMPVPCPRCGNVAFSIPAQGEPWRRCGGPRGCGFEWRAPVGKGGAVAEAQATKEVGR
jgi:hypothetical protein